MPLPQKRWIRIADLAQLWSLKATDIEDYALDAQIQLSVLVAHLPAEMGTWEGAGIGDEPLLQDLPILDGPQPLQRPTLLEIVRDGWAEVWFFATGKPNTYLRIRADAGPRVYRREDLIVTREERERFEREHGAVASPDPAAAAADYWHSDDCARVRFAGVLHKFGRKQAAVLRLLKAAADKGEPWCDGQQLLHDADAGSMRLVDLFKYKPVWRELVQSDGSGKYRLNILILPPEQRRIRLFRRTGQAKFYPAAAKARTMSRSSAASTVRS